MGLRINQDGAERRQYRRHDLEGMGVSVERWDPYRQSGKELGRIVDLSAGGVRVRCRAADVRVDGQIRVRVQLPEFAGIRPFVAEDEKEGLKPSAEWVGWLAVSRVKAVGNGEVDVAGRLVDMGEMDRGMLGLYLSTQPLAA